MVSGAPTTQEKLLWERHSNKLLCEELKVTKHQLAVVKAEFAEYKFEMTSNNLGQMLNKLNKLKAQKITDDLRISKLKKDNEELLNKCIKVQLELNNLKLK
jgi:hypothetical protein